MLVGRLARDTRLSERQECRLRVDGKGLHLLKAEPEESNNITGGAVAEANPDHFGGCPRIMLER